uniref:Nuclear pore complex protein Nup214 n=1 Tax=Esox lucius TaxID=8010 RepID=A0A6Q2Z6F2_ESOLU
MQDFQFRQMKKARVFDSPGELPKYRSSLLAISNKFGLTFVALDRKIKVYQTQDILAANKVDGNSNEIVEGIPALSDVPVELPVYHLGLSSDELTLSVSSMSEESGLLLAFYDVRTFINKMQPQKFPFATLRPGAGLGIIVQDLKWNPALASILAVCLSDGSMMVLDVMENVTVQARLPATEGITCVCWSPKGKQVAAGKMNATVSQYTPGLQEKKVIPCPSFYSSDNPVKVLDVQWLSTFVFAVVYAAADGCPETPPELVVISLPTKNEKSEERYLNFNDPVYGTCTERQHHYFLSHIEDWDIVLAASAASIEVSVIAKQEDKTNWELWLLEDASRGELPVSQSNDDTLPLGLAIAYTSQQEIHITDEKTLPPAPTLLLLSTDGVLCPFSLLNLNPGVKQLVAAPTSLSLEGERLPPAGSAAPTTSHASLPSVPSISTTSSAPPPLVSSLFTSSATAPGPTASSGFSFSMPPSSTTSPAFSLRGSTAFSGATSNFPGFSFASVPQTESSTAASAFSFNSPKPQVVETALTPAPTPTPQHLATTPTPTPQRLAATSPTVALRGTPEPATPAVKLNLNERFSCWFCSSQIAHFQKELDDLKARSNKADFRVGSAEEMKELRIESEDLHVFTLEIKETTESLHGDISTLKTSMLEGFAGAEDAKAQCELNRDRAYRQLLYKKPLDPRSEDQLKEIRRLYQYVKFAVEDVNDVLDVEWEKHLEKKKKQKHMIVPEREALFTALANNLDIINQQKQRLDKLVKDLHALRLYNKTAAWTTPPPCHLDNELESLRDALLKASLETIPKMNSKSPAKMSPVKQSQLRNFLSKRQTPPVRSTAPANLSRSAFLSPQYYEDLDDVSSTSSLSQALDPDHAHFIDEEEEPEPAPVLPPSLPRHPTVVRTPSIAPGFGAIQSTPFSKVHPGLSMGLGLSPIISQGADSTALATKTVKHGAPPSEKAVPLPAQQAAAKAAFLRQMANQKPAISASLTESTLKTVPQVVNVQELKDKGPHPPVSTVIRYIFISSTLARLLITLHYLLSALVRGFPVSTMFGKTVYFYLSPVKDTSKFSFGSTGSSGKIFDSFAPKTSSSALGGTGSPTPVPSMSGEPVRPSNPPTLRLEPQGLKVVGGETLGSFSGLRVGQGDEDKPSAAAFSFGLQDNGAAQFSFGSTLPQVKPAESALGEADSTVTDLSKIAFKPPVTKPAFSTSAATSFSSLLAAPLSSSLPLEKDPPKTSTPLSDPTVLPDPGPSQPGPSINPPVSEPEVSTTPEASVTPIPEKAPTPPAPIPSPATTVTSGPTVTPASDTLADPSAHGPTGETVGVAENTPAPEARPPAANLIPDAPPPAYHAPVSDKPASIVAQAPAVTTDSTTVAATSLTLVINTTVLASTTPTPSDSNAAASATGSIFGTAGGFGSTSFGAPPSSGPGVSFGKYAFGQSVGGFGQPAANSAGGFSFGQSAFGSASGFGQATAALPAATASTAAAGGGLFGAPTASNASSFSFGTPSASTASSTGTSLFGQPSATPAFGQQSAGFGQGSVFGSNTTTTSSTGFSFGQPAGERVRVCIWVRINTKYVFSLCVPSENWQMWHLAILTLLQIRSLSDVCPTGGTTLFGSSGAKTFGFGSPASAFGGGEQKPSGTFSTGGGSVAAQGFGSFSTPAKQTGGFGSAPVFGSPPAFGGSPAFGGTAAFGSAPSFSSPMGSGSKVFGEGTAAANVGGFG